MSVGGRVDKAQPRPSARDLACDRAQDSWTCPLTQRPERVTLATMRTNSETSPTNDEPSEVAALQRRVLALEHKLAETAAPHVASSSSRRGMLRLAGAAVVGGAGAMLINGGQAAAATGNMQYGASNDAAGSITSLKSSASDTLDVYNSDTAGTAVYGSARSGGTGVYGEVSSPASDAYGVWGESLGNLGYGIVATGGQAQLYLFPKATVGPFANVNHETGEVAFDSASRAFWGCVTAGTPGVWRKLGGVDTSGSFHAIATARVYDSRLAAPGPQAPLASGQNRVIGCKDKRDTITGAVLTANAIPAGATAVAFNLTVIATSAGGFLSVEPGDAANFGGSTANWTAAGQVIANASVVKLDTTRQVKVFCGGGGSADFIIDIVGYYL
jgi:hypothetical protein